VGDAYENVHLLSLFN